jgi:tetratricopeptide (TPR) repeat protein
MSRALVLGFLLALGMPSVAHADAVDEAYVLGNESARAGDWQAAVRSYERANVLLGQPSSALSYNLGTAYAQLGELGRASFHLMQALEFRGNPTTEIAEAARSNLAVVRRRAELQAATSGALIDRPETWWDLVVEMLRAPGVGWLALLSGFVALAGLVMRRARAAAARRPKLPLAVLLGCIACYLVAGTLHGLSLRADRTEPRAVILDARADAREGPGTHRAAPFAIAGGSRVRIADRTPGWALVRLPGGIEGWVVESAVAELGGPIGQGLPSPAQ